MSRPRGGRWPGWLLIAVLAIALCGIAAACSGGPTYNNNNQNGTNCSGQGNGNSASCSQASSPGPSGTAVAGNSHQSQKDVELLGDDAIFHDPKVTAALKRDNFTVVATSSGSREVCKNSKEAANIDFSDSSAPEVPCYAKLAQENNEPPSVAHPYRGLMVIATYKPIVALLKQLHIASVVNGITVFDMAQYLKVFKSGMRWNQIPGNTAYPSFNRIMLWTTDPQNSNMGGMLAYLASVAQDGGDQPVSVSPNDQSVKLIASLYTELGSLDPYSGLLVSDFFGDDDNTYPMAMMYESQYLSSIVTGQATDKNLAFMYPNPDVEVADAMVGYTDKGKGLINEVQSPMVQSILDSEGYRTEKYEPEFVAAMARQRIIVPRSGDLQKKDQIQVALTPTDRMLTKLINAVVADESH